MKIVTATALNIFTLGCIIKHVHGMLKFYTKLMSATAQHNVTESYVLYICIYWERGCYLPHKPQTMGAVIPNEWCIGITIFIFRPFFGFGSEMVREGSKWIMGGNYSQTPYGDFWTDSQKTLGHFFFWKAAQIMKTSRGQKTNFLENQNPKNRVVLSFVCT